MALPDFSMRQLLEAGAHFGHQTHRWNPKMERYIFGSRANIHIIDLSQTMPLLHQALVKVREVAASGGRVLFVGTKRQASEPVADRRQALRPVLREPPLARRHADQLAHHLGVDRAPARTGRRCSRARRAPAAPKKELLKLTRERDKLELSLGGIKDMGGIPDLMFVIDTNKEAIAIQEARKLNIPVVAILDTNCDPDGITFPIPGNDDAARALQLYCDLVADAVLDGLTEGQAALGVDIGAAEAPIEPALRRSQRQGGRCAERREPEPEPEPRRPKPSRRPSAEAETSGRARYHRRGGGPRRRLRASPRRKAELSSLRTSGRGVCATDTLTGGKTMADITAAHGEGPARDDRRGHDGLQEGAAGNRRRHRGRHRLAARQGPRPRPPRRPTASPPRASSPSPPRKTAPA